MFKILCRAKAHNMIVERYQVTLSHKFCEMPHQEPSPTTTSICFVGTRAKGPKEKFSEDPLPLLLEETVAPL